MRMDSGKRNEERSSALWGTGGNRGGETRSNALWGKGGRGMVTALVAMLAISVPLAASKTDGGDKHAATYISPVLTKKSPSCIALRIGVQSSSGPGTLSSLT